MKHNDTIHVRNMKNKNIKRCDVLTDGRSEQRVQMQAISEMQPQAASHHAEHLKIWTHKKSRKVSAKDTEIADAKWSKIAEAEQTQHTQRWCTDSIDRNYNIH